MDRLTRLSLARPRLVLLGAGLVLVVAVGVVLITPDRLGIAGFGDPGSQSARATDRLERALGYDPEPGMVVLAGSPAGFRSAPAQAAVTDLARRLSRYRSVAKTETAFGPDGIPLLVSRDIRKTVVLVHFHKQAETRLTAIVDQIRRHLHAPGLTLAYGGFNVGIVDDNRIARSDLVRAEVIAFPLIALLLIWVFRGVLAAMLPLAIGGFSVVGTFAGLRLLSQAFDFSIFALNAAVLLGLGLAVDYGLFLVSRYREEVRAGRSGPDAVQTVTSTAGRTVLLSGCTVAAASATLLLFPEQFIYSMGVGAIFVSLLSATAAVTIVPALLALAGHRIAATGTALNGPAREGRWSRVARFVMRRPVSVALASTILILAMGAPALGVRWTFLDARALPGGLESRRVADTLRTEFTPYLEFPVSIAVKLDVRDHRSDPSAIPTSIAALPSAGIVAPLRQITPRTGMVQLLSSNPPLSSASQRLIANLRALPYPLLVGGRIADFVDLKHSIGQRAPPAIALAALTTLLLLFLLTGSLVLPIKTVIMNGLSLAAVFGLLVVIFQNGALGLASLIAYDGPDAIEVSVSVVVVAVTFALASDYSILLLSRIKEAYDAGRTDADAIAEGMQRSGPVITNAAILLAVALLALASSRVFLAKQLVVGLALGVTIDAIIVRALLIPSIMRLLGRINWWAPEPLRRHHARIARKP